MKKVKIIAEVGCNHKGDMSLAKEFIDIASSFCNVDVVKFQKRNNEELLTKEQYNAPHPVPENSYGDTYGAHREYLEFNLDQHRELKEHCESRGLIYSTSVWDLTSAKEIVSLNPELIKIPSACNNHYEMLEWICKNYEGEIHCSVGMTTWKEIDALVQFFERHKRAKDVVLYSCTSGYPVEFEDTCLLEIIKLKEAFGTKLKAVGFSGHHLGIAIDNASIALGATWVERHFTLDRTYKGTDHAASLEPNGMRKLSRDLRATMKSLSYKKSDVLEVEQAQRDKLKYRKQ